MKDCCKKTQRNDEQKKALVNRLSRIEGQIRGIRKMVDDDRYCIDIITQVAATTAALNSFNKELLEQHIRTCVSDDIKSGNEEVAGELLETLKKLMR